MSRKPQLAMLLLVGVFSLACTGASVPGAGDAESVATATASAPARGFTSVWATDPVWDDGRAEVALYDARRPQYGKVESYEAVFIVVKEDFNRELHVKADAPHEGKDLLPVLKLNAVHSYWTPNYPYHYMASVFVRRENPAALVKLTVGSQEWCGNTFKEVTTWEAPQLHFHSYFDGQGDGSRPLPMTRGDLLEEQLPLALRGLEFRPGLELRLRVLPSLISNNLRGPVEFQLATLRVEGEESLTTPAGNFTAWKVRLKLGEVEQTWWFEKESPHGLLKMESSDGRAWELKARTREAYWQRPTYEPAM